ncbi:hypothetical protein BOTBODRAFT_32114 [Botryobasidium botryosum FD-172 SS1]|uniref:Uncharacterized protein n=1 Tax=Botryobasidium botryosum (strain FD-172 SS1) TaxID=930990 RepID=A0A067MK71_BOTB1|nr:hypothetical protein BOTBODRAFT_32114 [Botryobasidium botryosum FD-172 SS1]
MRWLRPEGLAGVLSSRMMHAAPSLFNMPGTPGQACWGGRREPGVINDACAVSELVSPIH